MISSSVLLPKALIGVGVGVGGGIGVGVGAGVGSPSWFTRLVLQPFLGLKGEKIFSSKQQQKQAAASSKQATELISAYPHISINIDGTSPKLSWYIALVIIYKPTRFRSKLTKGQGQWAKKS